MPNTYKALNNLKITGTLPLPKQNIRIFLYEKIKITPVFMAPLLSLWC